MSTGLDLDENGPAMNEIFSEEDWIEATFKRQLVSIPGKQFKYCTFLTHAMSQILDVSSGKGLLELSEKYLFEPLGIKLVHWEMGPNGYYFGGDKLWLTPRAMAKFGYLFLNDGKWGDEQVIPEEWVRESIKNRFDEFPDTNFTGYGYWWWLGKNGSYFARGAFGQIISIYPDEDIVVVFTGASNSHWHLLTNEYIFPAIKSAGPLPPNPAANNRIKMITRDLELPVSLSPRPLPETAKNISGKKFLLQKNDLDFSELTFYFEESNQCRLSIKYEDNLLDMLVGLDEVYRVNDGIKWGIKSEKNIIALKGNWKDENTFIMEFHEVGEPWYLDVELEFDEDSLISSFTWQPFRWQFQIEGEIE
jgi:hypothetical protein